MAEKRNPKTGRPRYKGNNGDKTRRVTSRRIRRENGLAHLKPPKFKDYLTLSEVALAIPIDPIWLKRLEAQDRIPRAARVPMGKLQMRLWSPEQVEEIRTIIEGHKIGRPKES